MSSWRSSGGNGVRPLYQDYLGRNSLSLSLYIYIWQSHLCVEFLPSRRWKTNRQTCTCQLGLYYHFLFFSFVPFRPKPLDSVGSSKKKALKVQKIRERFGPSIVAFRVFLSLSQTDSDLASWPKPLQVCLTLAGEIDSHLRYDCGRLQLPSITMRISALSSSGPRAWRPKSQNRRLTTISKTVRFEIADQNEITTPNRL